jgi:hypothetical protein
MKQKGKIKLSKKKSLTRLWLHEHWQGSSLAADHSHHLAEVHFENHAPRSASGNDVTYQVLPFKIRTMHPLGLNIPQF